MLSNTRTSIYYSGGDSLARNYKPPVHGIIHLGRRRDHSHLPDIAQVAERHEDNVVIRTGVPRTTDGLLGLSFLPPVLTMVLLEQYVDGPEAMSPAKDIYQIAHFLPYCDQFSRSGGRVKMIDKANSTVREALERGPFGAWEGKIPRYLQFSRGHVYCVEVSRRNAHVSDIAKGVGYFMVDGATGTEKGHLIRGCRIKGKEVFPDAQAQLWGQSAQSSE